MVARARRLCIVGSCPGGTASNVVTFLARADVSLSVAMTTASTLGAVVATPLLTRALLGTLVPVDALALLVSTLQVWGGWGGPLGCGGGQVLVRSLAHLSRAVDAGVVGGGVVLASEGLFYARPS